jgi:hypothetical protein
VGQELSSPVFKSRGELVVEFEAGKQKNIGAVKIFERGPSIF